MVEYLNENFKKLFLQPRRTVAKNVRNKILQGIQGSAKMSEGACIEIVETIVRYHGKCRDKCHSGHPILQIALKFCFLNRLQDSRVVSELLKEIYLCENTFEKLFAGAVFGVNASYLTSGWKSDFSNSKENVEAVEFFLIHSNRSKCLFGNKRLQEVTMMNCNLPPLIPTIQIRNNEMFTLLMRYGAGFAKSKHLNGLRDLKLLCKYKILYMLWKNWELPSGIPKLPLPETLIKYIENVDLDSGKVFEEQLNLTVLTSSSVKCG